MGELQGFTKEQRAFVRAAIREAREAGYKDGREDAGRESPYHRTEKRLYAIPDLEERIKDWHADIDALETGKLTSRRSRDIVLYSGGKGITEGQKLEALIRKKEADIEEDERELGTMRRALKKIEGDEYYQTVALHYIQKIKDDREKAEIMGLEYTSSLYKNRMRLVKRLTAILYGAAALK